MPAETEDSQVPPPGFGPTNSRGAFTLHNGPTYRATARGDVRSGFYVLGRHCNGMGFLHGGMMSAFADSALAWSVWNETKRFSVTLKLTLEYFDIVKKGAWLEAHPERPIVSDPLVYVSAPLITASGRVAARADGVFRMMKRVPRRD